MITRTHVTRRQQAQLLNSILDQALLNPTSSHRHQIQQLIPTHHVEKLVERLRKRAIILSKQQPYQRHSILEARDALILTLYAAAAPRGWACAWCDGSYIKIDAQQRAGIGAILMDDQGEIVARIGQAIGAQDSFTAELTAVVAIMQTALKHDQRQLWVYCDNYGLIQLWCEQRHDSRLAEIRRLAATLDRFSLHPIPRQHNQPAHRLALAATRCTDDVHVGISYKNI
ncbi:Reverse transcriptase-like [Nitrosomonas sp. Nm33]|nr:Reverse transcriptase-like [Nitrosomonas sp. Nm33]